MVDGDCNYNAKDWIVNYGWFAMLPLFASIRVSGLKKGFFFPGKFGVGRGQGWWSLRSREKSVRSDNELVPFPLCTHRYIKSCWRHFLLLFCDFITSRKVFL